MARTATKKRRRLRHRETNERCLSVFPSSLGWMAAAWRDGRLHGLTIGHEDPRAAVEAMNRKDADIEEVIRPTLAMRRFADRMHAYSDGHPDDFLDVPIDLSARTEFARRVLQQCRHIPYGHTLSYAELAAAAGSPRACRAVGNVMASNRVPLVIPCHRVIGSRGSLGGYSAPNGLSLKRRLLRLEGMESALT